MKQNSYSLNKRGSLSNVSDAIEVRLLRNSSEDSVHFCKEKNFVKRWRQEVLSERTEK